MLPLHSRPKPLSLPDLLTRTSEHRALVERNPRPPPKLRQTSEELIGEYVKPLFTLTGSGIGLGRV